MAKLRYGIVTFKDKRAGILSETADGGTVFVYDEDAPEIACALPRALDEHEWSNGLHPVFAHMAPEGWLRSRQRAIADISEDDDFGLLLAFGRDCIGAIGIEDPEAFASGFDLGEAADAETRAIAAARRTIPGVQEKLLCACHGDRYAPAQGTEAAPYIAKFNREDLIDLVGNEAFSLELVRLLLPDDQVVTAERTILAGINRPALMVNRFDRVGPDRRGKLRCEDFAQVLSVPPGRDRSAKYTVGYEALAAALERSAAPVLDGYRLFKRLVAFCLIGNTDCHLKNWSLLETSDGLRLSPIYDVLNGYLYGAQGYSTRFGLQLDGQAIQWDVYDRALLTEIGRRLRLTERAIEQAFKDVGKARDAVFARLDGDIPLGPGRTHAFRASVLEKWETIFD
ncbi:MAG: type II toxin-antitoxin system HipA family toxin [Alphaproteobacteria bacterium]|nr:MAG: type II toxin-antitoxin system HipA family toxin [Alphaproteobacteria bacterium]